MTSAVVQTRGQVRWSPDAVELTRTERRFVRCIAASSTRWRTFVA